MMKEQYQKAVISCFNQLALGEIFPSLPCVEQWCEKHFGLQIGGKATEVAFTALRKFGMTVGEIQKSAGINL